ncbi:ester cyclase [Chloroflexota bacterium]
MGIEENKANIKRQVEDCWNKGDFASVPELISPDFVYHTPKGDLIGQEGFKQWVTIWRTALPDLHFAIDEIVGEEDTVAVRLSWSGTFIGRFQNHEPTGNRVAMNEGWFYHFTDGKDLGPLPFGNLLSVVQQMGVDISN